MAASREGLVDFHWSQFVPLLGMFAGVTGAVLVLGKIRGSSGYLMPLVEGAWIGGLIALVVAIGFVVTLPVKAPRLTRQLQAFISFALAAVTVLSILSTSTRLNAGEYSDNNVTLGLWFYAITVLLQCIAGVAGLLLARRPRAARG